jgi:myo-inositol catabolism protein IolC
MAIGYDQPLYLMPFDHRESLQTKMFGWWGTLSAAQTAEIAAAKQVIYDGFLEGVRDGVPKEHAGILVDEQFGAAILRDAAGHGYTTACPVEKSGQKEFVFDYGEDFARHIEAINPKFCKVFVRYNPEGDTDLNHRQAARLKRLSDYLHGSDRLFMFELVVPAEPRQLERCQSDPKAYDRELAFTDDSGFGHLERFQGDPKAYDRELRPALMVRTIHDLQEAGVEPDIWKVEGLDLRDDCAKVVAVARRDGRDRVGCIILGRGEDGQKVRAWLTTAASVTGFIGFAVGRTTWWGPLVDWRANRIKREAAVAEIARRYREWVDIFEKARSSLASGRPELRPSCPTSTCAGND